MRSLDRTGTSYLEHTLLTSSHKYPTNHSDSAISLSNSVVTRNIQMLIRCSSDLRCCLSRVLLGALLPRGWRSWEGCRWGSRDCWGSWRRRWSRSFFQRRGRSSGGKASFLLGVHTLWLYIYIHAVSCYYTMWNCGTTNVDLGARSQFQPWPTC